MPERIPQMTTLTVGGLAQKLNGEVRGDPAAPLEGAAALEKAGPRDVTFAVDEQNIRRLPTSQAAACIVSRVCLDHALLGTLKTSLLFVDDPMDAFVAAMREFRPAMPREAIGISPAAHVHPTAVLGAECNVYPGVWIGAGTVLGARCDVYPGVYIGVNCRIGDDCVLHPNVVLYPEVILGKRVTLHASAVIGADGFGYRFRDGCYEKIPQLGWVHIHDDCEIGACTTIDRGMIGPTVIGQGTHSHRRWAWPVQ
jgi:UDP-3-O-[3-hydroxymyristoyl] glucosamine N-acyltransferase